MRAPVSYRFNCSDGFKVGVRNKWMSLAKARYDATVVYIWSSRIIFLRYVLIREWNCTRDRSSNSFPETSQRFNHPSVESGLNETREICIVRSIASRLSDAKKGARHCEILIGSRFDRIEERIYFEYIYIYIHFWEFEIQKSNGKLAFHRVSISMRFYLAFEYGLDGKLSYYRLTLSIALLFSTRIRSVGKKERAWKRGLSIVSDCEFFYFDQDVFLALFFSLSFFFFFYLVSF